MLLFVAKQKERENMDERTLLRSSLVSLSGVVNYFRNQCTMSAQANTSDHETTTNGGYPPCYIEKNKN